MPAAIPLAGLAVSAGMSGLQAIQANKDKKRAQDAINSYQRQQLTNPYDGLQVSTLGADRQREDLARTMATYGNLAAMGGTSAIASMLPNLVAQQNTQEAQIAAGLDQQQAQIDQLRASGQGQIQQMQEQRENNDLLGYGNQMSMANQQKSNALNQLAQTGAAVGMAAASGLFDQQTTPTTGGGFSNSNLHNNLISRLPNASNMTSPSFNKNNAYSFGNNINGFTWNNLMTPRL